MHCKDYDECAAFFLRSTDQMEQYTQENNQVFNAETPFDESWSPSEVPLDNSQQIANADYLSPEYEGRRRRRQATDYQLEICEETNFFESRMNRFFSFPNKFLEKLVLVPRCETGK